MSAERLLHWAAEIGTGTVTAFSDAHEWAIGASPAYRTLRYMSALGQLEVDWTRGRWGAVEPSLTLLPDAGGYGLIVGARTARLTDDLINDVDALDAEVQRVLQAGAPDAFFVAADSEQALEGVAAALQMPYLHSVTQRLAAVLPPLDAMLTTLRTPPIAYHYGVERYDLDYGWYGVDSEPGPGLYRYEISGPRKLHFVDSDGQRYDVDLALGSWAEARRHERSDFLYWRPDGANGTLDAPKFLPLPALHARTATLCSGLAARFDDSGGILYVNVPRWLAERIANTLAQPLNEE